VTRRLRGLALLLVALAGAVWAGQLVRGHLDGPGPVPIVRAATQAYATGDCAGLRAVSAQPRAVECSAVRDVQAAYRAEGLEPREFGYEVASQGGGAALVRISYVKGDATLDDLIPVEQVDGEWRVSQVSTSLD
jgi:hypothetical protein